MQIRAERPRPSGRRFRPYYSQIDGERQIHLHPPAALFKVSPSGLRPPSPSGKAALKPPRFSAAPGVWKKASRRVWKCPAPARRDQSACPIFHIRWDTVWKTEDKRRAYPQRKPLARKRKHRTVPQAQRQQKRRNSFRRAGPQRRFQFCIVPSKKLFAYFFSKKYGILEGQ